MPTDDFRRSQRLKLYAVLLIIALILLTITPGMARWYHGLIRYEQFMHQRK